LSSANRLQRHGELEMLSNKDTAVKLVRPFQLEELLLMITARLGGG
jgi:hypothetical protein